MNEIAWVVLVFVEVMQILLYVVGIFCAWVAVLSHGGVATDVVGVVGLFVGALTLSRAMNTLSRYKVGPRG